MSMVHVAPETHLVMDPLSGLVAEEREDIISYSMDPVMERIDELNKIADDLVNSLAPDRPLMNSFDGRENSSYKAGIYGNAFYGIIVGLVVAGVMALVLYMMSLISIGL